MESNLPNNRRIVIIGIILLIAVIYITKLFTLQVVDNKYKTSASSNVLRYVTQYPVRGLIYDRNNKLMVYNEAAYDLMVIQKQLDAFDTADFCKILDIDKDFLIESLKDAKIYSRYKPSVLIKQISAKTYAILQEQMYKFPGFFTQTRTLRKYPDSIAAHVLGYVGEVNEKNIEKEKYYKSGDYIGASGIEKSYEKYLRGEKGVNVFMVDVHNRIKGSYDEGRIDREAVPGKNISLTIDAELQKYGEKLMGKKKGSIVAIEPSTGEILCMITAPTYNPGLLSGRPRAKNFRKLQIDTLKPLFNRALQAQYPPGSTFKPMTALIGLQTGVVKPTTKYGCQYGYHVGNFSLGCHGHPSPLNLIESIQHSCNAYYCHVYRNILDYSSDAGIVANYTKWRELVMSFGYGKLLEIDFPFELKGLVPPASYFEKLYGNGWNSLMNVSMAIGQGELLVTPLQMANFSATIANRGYYYTPHLVKDIQGDDEIAPKYTVKRYTKVDSQYFEPVVQGMYDVVQGGPGSTARNARVDSLDICGKTGTAENPHGENHSIFIAFAPKDNPKIAISVYVENAGYGTTYAAPIASFMIEKYLTGKVKRKWYENYIMNANLLNVEKKD
ncbi:MAG: penicillin-binding protein 2 [Salinivirgaceae bacterium]|nr:MAG: penicillin-binding protein 2 [Salinivirgaceae bacterium]